MTLKNGLRLLFVLGCLSAPGCAGLDRPAQEKQKPPELELTKEESDEKYLSELRKDLLI